jgi:hypothetical protein
MNRLSGGAPQDLLVQRGRIASIAPADITARRHTLTPAGRFIPGLMDLHAHEYRPSLLAGFAYFGVTTIRDQGSPMGPLIAYADAIAAGKLDGPRVGFGGFQFYTDWAYDAEDQQGVEPEADPDHAARAVELARIFGSQHIKTRTFRRWDINALDRRGTPPRHARHRSLRAFAPGCRRMDAKEHGGFATTDASSTTISIRCTGRPHSRRSDDHVLVLRRAAERASRHARRRSRARAIPAGAQQLHLDAAAQPDPAPDVRGLRAVGAGGDDQARARGRNDRDRHRHLADPDRRPHGAGRARRGGTVAAGRDRAATGDAAKIIGAEQDLGTIAVGKWADLVILDADPVADIRNSRGWAVLRSGACSPSGAGANPKPGGRPYLELLASRATPRASS